MKYFLLFLFSLFLLCNAGDALANKRKHRGEPQTEVELINSITTCLRHKDTAAYFNLFPPFDTLWHMVLHNTDNSPAAAAQLSDLKEHPQALIEFDPMYNRDIMGRFCAILAKGEDSGILWSGTVIQRYELQRDNLTANLKGYDKIAPERYKGFVFIRDMLTRRTFCITITEMQKIKGSFFGGQVINILEASTIDQFLAKEQQERRYYAWLAAHPSADTAANDSLKTGAAADSASAKKSPLSISVEDDDAPNVRKEVVDRKYYEGMFDDEIPVKVYVRYLREVGNVKKVYYDGLYKFGDQQKYIRLDITKTPDGKWVMEDQGPIGVLELTFKDRGYTGTWTNNENQTGYDVVLKETGIPLPKVEMMDKILDSGSTGKADDDSVEDPDPKEKVIDEAEKRKKQNKEDKGNDSN